MLFIQKLESWLTDALVTLLALLALLVYYLIYWISEDGKLATDNLESRVARAKGLDWGLFGALSVVPRIPVYKPPPISGLFITVKGYVGPIAWITATYNLATVLLPIGH